MIRQWYLIFWLIFKKTNYFFIPVTEGLPHMVFDESPIEEPKLFYLVEVKKQNGWNRLGVLIF